ncbi:hypothetical protein TWF718_001209 [Orbilia javanica]|uniref:XPG-I domain-containing protein n=1 Tax=Orbilia javanica TaxID=47235 RepID=A0AAN8NH87_9PEZI
MAPNRYPQKSWSTRDPKSELNLWNLFSQNDQGKSTSLAHLATIHYKTHHRPLRIALDQDSWNYGLTRAQERSIQKSQRKNFKKQLQKSQSQTWCKKYIPSPKLRLFHREGNVLERLMGYIALGVEFYVIVPSPLDREDVGEFGDRYANSNGKMHMWFRILGDLGVRFHAAANPVVECAYMLEHGVVDAVWTNNPDVLVYCGPTAVVFRDFEEDAGGPSVRDVRVYRVEELRKEVSWSETVRIHTLFRSGYSIEDTFRVKGGDTSVLGTPMEGDLNLCKCTNQEEVNDWFQQLISPFSDLNYNPKRPRYHILEDYLTYSVSSNHHHHRSTEAQLFRQRCSSRMREIKQTHDDSLAFYDSNLMDRTRRLWEYSRDTFSVKTGRFVNLMAGVLIARRLGAAGGDLSFVTEHSDESIDPWTVRILVRIEDEPVLWNLRTKITKDITGMVLNPLVLKILVEADGSNS